MKIYSHKMLMRRISGAVNPARKTIAIQEETVLFKEISDDLSTSGTIVENHFDAHELFNQFTAHVIKRKIEFCR